MYPWLLSRNTWLLVQEVHKPQIAWRLAEYSGECITSCWAVCLVFPSICCWLLVELKWCSGMAFTLTQCRCPCVFIWRQTKSFFSIKEIILGGAQRSALESFQNSYNSAKEKFKVECLFLFGSFKAFFLKFKGQRKKRWIWRVVVLLCFPVLCNRQKQKDQWGAQAQCRT